MKKSDMIRIMADAEDRLWCKLEQAETDHERGLITRNQLSAARIRWAAVYDLCVEMEVETHK